MSKNVQVLVVGIIGDNLSKTDYKKSETEIKESNNLPNSKVVYFRKSLFCVKQLQRKVSRLGAKLIKPIFKSVEATDEKSMIKSFTDAGFKMTES